MSLEKELEVHQAEINTDIQRITPVVDYICLFCGKTFGETEHATEHAKTCLRNMYEVETCITCKHSCYNLMPTYGKKNGYSRLIQEGITSGFGYFTCEKGKDQQYNGKLSEEVILREDKQCYEPLKYGENFYVRRTKEYEEYAKIIERANDEQDDIEKDINEFWFKVNELDKQGYTKEEIKEVLEKEYTEEE